ncbi:hypothetical protein ACX40Y_06655 [Sphingomonas sp. RS6]
MSRTASSAHRFPLWLSALFLLALAGCSYAYPIDVDFVGGEIVFSAEDRSSGCLSHFEVTSEAGDLMWSFDKPLKFSECRSDFPLKYGATPEDATDSKPAKKLMPNVRYYVYATDGDTYYGSFRFRRVLSMESDPEKGRDGPNFRSVTIAPANNS